MPHPPRTVRLQALIAALEDGLLERAEAVRLALLAALAGEHVLLIGPPGTAKSELARRLHRAFEGARYFERLLTRFSTPEELFGPLSLKALEHDRYERLTEGYLPTASVAFLDEVFKANSAILNALLTLLNEREFDNGAGRQRTPLISVIGASNEVPQDDGLSAFYDRFLVRVPVQAVSDASFAPLLALAPTPPARVAALTATELAAWLNGRDAVPLEASVVRQLEALRQHCAAQHITVSDRRWRQLTGLLRTAAHTEGRTQVDELDLWLVPYTLAASPEQVPGLHQWFVREVAQAEPQLAPWLGHAVQAFEVQLDLEASAQAQEGDDSAGKLALARSMGGAADDDGAASGGMRRLMTASLEAHRRRHYSRTHVAARVAQVAEIQARAAMQRQALATQAAALVQALQGRVWLPPALARALTQAHHDSLAVLDALLVRLAQTHAGFTQLPVDPQRDGEAPPQPVALQA